MKPKNKTPQPSNIHANNMLISNFKSMRALTDNKVTLNVTTALFNDEVFIETGINKEDMDALIRCSYQLKKRCIPVKKVKAIIEVVKEIRKNRNSSDNEE